MSDVPRNDEEEFEVLLCGYLDGELDAQQRQRFEVMLEECPSRRQELESMKQLCDGATAVYAGVRLPDAAWDTFLNDVYNRMERRAGWALLLFGLLALAVFSFFEFIYEPWASAVIKVLVAIPLVGLLVLFVSVLRHRLHNLKTDRYEREVHH
jgi:anti-sigma factor RsiW